MSEKIRLAIVGCGGMGHRHMYGLAELHRTGWERFELVGACDPVRDNAESLANQAAEHFGSRPAVVTDLDGLAALGVEAVDVTTTPRYHHTVAVETLERGWHTMVEKPMGLTVRACNLIARAAAASDAILSVAENYRRDPINRLAKALLNAGVIGDPRFLIHHAIGGGDRMLISVWRHQKDQSGVLLDVGVHYTDMMEYLLGEIQTVYAQTRLYEPIRKNPAAGSGTSGSNPAGVYGRWQKEMPAEFEATAEDAAYATLTFKNGVVGQYIEDHAGRGQGVWARHIYGSRGSMVLPGDRSGGNLTLHVDGEAAINNEKILDLVPDFHLDAVTTDLFGGNRLWCYEFPFPETDRKIIAIEYGDFAEAISGEHPVEVDAEQGTRSVAVSYAILESGETGRLITIDEMIAEQVDDYQREINESLAI
ncbi:MAG: Gfo/Idh/MocA family oxidoreductase [Candidatus Poribacteria bacterium]|nr:Gfo/Idh/MocA family oxidoreductase [Candidatus Poribacteria bacterium]